MVCQSAGVVDAGAGLWPAGEAVDEAARAGRLRAPRPAAAPGAAYTGPEQPNAPSGVARRHCGHCLQCASKCGCRVAAPLLTKVRMSCSRATAARRTMALEQIRMATACGTSNGECDRWWMPRSRGGGCHLRDEMSPGVKHQIKTPCGCVTCAVISDDGLCICALLTIYTVPWALHSCFTAQCATFASRFEQAGPLAHRAYVGQESALQGRRGDLKPRKTIWQHAVSRTQRSVGRVVVQHLLCQCRMATQMQLFGA